MKAIVVYESLWGNTAAIARAIAEGIGPQAQALPTDQATSAVIADADLIVAGAARSFTPIDARVVGDVTQRPCPRRYIRDAHLVVARQRRGRD